jgi:hypothetical protein
VLSGEKEKRKEIGERKGREGKGREGKGKGKSSAVGSGGRAER